VDFGCILISIGAASIWPVVLVGFALAGAVSYERQGASDPADAPAYVLIGSFIVGTALFVVALPLVFVGTQLEA
jgi:hypothetical protein